MVAIAAQHQQFASAGFGGEMRRRDFITGLGGSVAIALGPRKAAADDTAALKQLVREDYEIFYRQRDDAKYRALLTDDYLLLEQGKVYDVAGDLSTMPKVGADYHRVDSFGFKKVRVDGDTGYIVYFLRSQITEKGTTRNGEWLESVVTRRSGGRWRVALLHSTRIAKPFA